MVLPSKKKKKKTHHPFHAFLYFDRENSNEKNEFVLFY